MLPKSSVAISARLSQPDLSENALLGVLAIFLSPFRKWRALKNDDTYVPLSDLTALHSLRYLPGLGIG